MPFTGNDDDIVFLCQFDGAVNGFTTVDDDFMVLSRLKPLFNAFFDFCYDGIGVFRTRVIRSDDGNIGKFCADAAMMGRLVRSRSPPQPKTAMTWFGS